jgi:hypothetical protein
MLGRVGLCMRVCAPVALLTQHAKRMHHIVTSFVASLAALHPSTLSHKRHDFLRKYLNIKCVLISLHFYLKNISLEEESAKVFS